MADDSMGDEQMVYDGLTGNDADAVPAKIPTGADSMTSKIPDGVDAGGQAFTVDVETMEMDEGDGSDVLVEPGQAAPTPAPAQQRSAPPTFRPGHINGNGHGHANGNGNGAYRNGTSPNNGAQRNGAPVAIRNGAAQRPPAPRNRVRNAFENGAPLIQGTGAATSVEGAQNFEPGGPTGNPNPAAFGWGMGQTQPDPGVSLATSLIKAGADVTSTAIAAKTGLPQFQPATGQPATAAAAQQSAPTNYTPWIIGLGVLGAVGFGIWWLKRKPEASVAAAAPAPAQPKANPGRKAKLKKKKFRKTC